MSDLFHEGLRRLEQQDKRGLDTELLAALRAVEEDARRAGLNKMTAREIDAEIAAARRDRRVTKIKPPDR